MSNHKLQIAFRFLSTVMVPGCHTHEKDQAQYALCDWCVFKRHNEYNFCNLALECESLENLRLSLMLFLVGFIWRWLVNSHKTSEDAQNIIQVWLKYDGYI